ncbi:uncharacterized protein LOC116261556 [Nymphaea colorata]|nr:uncharacterized protein LOC116261556 [Nymphaea colorata]
MSIGWWCCSTREPVLLNPSLLRGFFGRKGRVVGWTMLPNKRFLRQSGARASAVDSQESSSDFVKRMEQAWLISQQPRPVVCSTCNSKGYVECKWCGGTGFFILGDNMLCQVPSRNTSCVICAGKGSACCSSCKGTGFRAKWLEQRTSSNP